MLNNQQTVLLKIAERFNDHNVKWALGGSLMLHYYKLIDHARDIDILVAVKDIEQALIAIETIATPLVVVQKQEYLTDCFKSFNTDGVDIDIMAGFKIKHSRGVYQFPFNNTTVCQTIVIDDVVIPLSSIEDWYIAYLLMPNREAKVNLIERHFNKHGIAQPQILKDALRQALPENIRNRINKLLI